MKAAAIQLTDTVAPLDVAPLETGMKRLAARLRESIARAAVEEPLELSDTERLVRDAQSLRAAFLRGTKAGGA